VGNSILREDEIVQLA